MTLRFQEPGGDDETLDFGGAFVDFGDAGVAVVAFDGVFAGVAVAAVDLDGFVRGAGGHLTGEMFGDGGCHPESFIEDNHNSYVRDRRTLNLIGYAGKSGVSAMSDEKEIREVMRAERKHKTVEQQEADLKQFMLKAIRNCD
jgi:hypothetical protein